MQSLTLATGSDRYLRTNSGLTLRLIRCTENPIIAASPFCFAFSTIVPEQRAQNAPATVELSTQTEASGGNPVTP
jgi:hypothetical protein